MVVRCVTSSAVSPPVPSNFFAKVQWPNPVTARLFNEDDSVTVDFSIEGIVLTVDLEDTGWTRERVKRLFVELARIALPISRGDGSVNRLGIVDNYVIEHQSPGEVAVTTLTSLRTLGAPSDFTLRTAFRNPTEAGLVRSGVDDWRNTIIQVGTSKKREDSDHPEELRVSLDHQIHYLPQRRFSPQLVDAHYERFLIHIGQLQTGPLAGLMPQDRTAHGRS
jgi:hypothetical protein